MSVNLIVSGPYCWLADPVAEDDFEYLKKMFVWVDEDDPTVFHSAFVPALGKFFRGCAEEIFNYLAARGYVVIRQDYPPEVKRIHDWSIDKQKYPYRPLQKEFCDRLLECGSGPASASAGSGKSYCITDIASRLGGATIVVTYRDMLVKQLQRDICEYTGLKRPQVGVWGAGMRSNPETCKIIVASDKTVLQVLNEPNSREARWLRNKVQVVIFDEGHHAVANIGMRLLHTCNAMEVLFAFTATYTRDDTRDNLQRWVFGPPNPEASITYGMNIEAGNLVPMTVYERFLPHISQGLQGKKYPTKAALKAMMYKAKVSYGIFQDWYNEIIVADAIRQNDLGRTVVIQVDIVEHGERLYRMLKEKAPHLKYHLLVSGGSRKTNSDQAKKITDLLYERRISGVISTKFDEGVDVKTLDTVIVATPNKGDVKTIQRARCTRSCDVVLKSGIRYTKTRGFYLHYHFNTDWYDRHTAYRRTALLNEMREHESNVYWRQKPNGEWVNLMPEAHQEYLLEKENNG